MDKERRGSRIKTKNKKGGENKLQSHVHINFAKRSKGQLFLLLSEKGNLTEFSTGLKINFGLIKVVFLSLTSYKPKQQNIRLKVYSNQINTTENPQVMR